MNLAREAVVEFNALTCNNNVHATVCWVDVLVGCCIDVLHALEISASGSCNDVFLVLLAEFIEQVGCGEIAAFQFSFRLVRHVNFVGVNYQHIGNQSVKGNACFQRLIQ